LTPHSNARSKSVLFSSRRVLGNEAALGVKNHFLYAVTAMRLRPLARRERRTLRPPTVSMRARKPWVLKRRVLCG
jgi:hypothetical protein